jgi:oligosaccharyltransferase complex subunit delta (ribophorin II)
MHFFFSLGYSFHIAAHLGTDGTFAFDRIEDAIVQADEVDSRFLQFEGGLSITGIYLYFNCWEAVPIKH